jgi:glycine betaine catabolism A
MERRDDPDWQAHADNDAPQFSGTLRDGAETWSGDGSAHGRAFADLTDENRRAGQTYVTHLPSFFVVGHVDYVRTVSLRPLGPARTELTAEWYFAEETKPATAEALDNVVAFGKLVLDQDAAICEVNQRGLSALPHRHGTLMPEEYEIARFHAWIAARTD